ncbi:UDP-N-acetylmuramate--L-alanine ligase [Ponticaulis profundi]|uniref:UDP-N-acetylmuramate--L-alanine ligase n=1 Tax=Ponticaulis profundi TaxID=2665222 RepID=A0ABW1S4U7_9PROT
MSKRYFFCGIGGSGMLPLAMIVKGQGADVSGSDRARDQGRSEDKFAYLESQGFRLFPQDGSGPDGADQALVASAAVEDSVPDVAAALANGAVRLSRAELLSSLFNAAGRSIGVAGTSGKSTTTGMIGWVLADCGQDPTIMNGAVMKNFVAPDALFASARVGAGDIFVSEVDESDGSIAGYTPHIAVINNISLDHKTMDELRALFSGFAARAKHVVLNLDNEETRLLTRQFSEAVTYSVQDNLADFVAKDILPGPTSIEFDVFEAASGNTVRVHLKTPGLHNVSNALAAIATVTRLGVSLEDACASLDRFTGIRRRFDIVGTTPDNITVIDDFGHNPDKIAATLKTLHDFSGRLLIMFQPHGFGPLRKMKSEFVECFVEGLKEGDVLLMPQPVYFGGTVDRSVTSEDLTREIEAAGFYARTFETRADCGEKLLEFAQAGDRIVIMGARDDTLSEFAADILERLQHA